MVYFPQLKKNKMTRGESTRNIQKSALLFSQLLWGNLGEQERQILRHRVWLVGGGKEPIGLQTPDPAAHTPKKFEVVKKEKHENNIHLHMRIDTHLHTSTKFGTSVLSTTYNENGHL